MMTACAPGTGPALQKTPDPATPTPSAAPSAVVPAKEEPTPIPVEEANVSGAPEARPTPDWKQRYDELYAHFLESYEAPEIGGVVEVEMNNGSVRRGKLVEITEESLLLSMGQGAVTLYPSSLSERARKRFFRKDFARLNAMERGRVEYAAWKREEEARTRPTPTPESDVAAHMPGLGRDGVNLAHRVDPNAPPPKNEGENGKVWQVDEYLRRHSAVPDSIRYKQWGRVQKHENGYKVRVRYSVESAANLGVNHEDMMFFMYADGKVYRRAPVK